MRKIIFLSCLLFFGFSGFANGAQHGSEPAVILYHDGTGSLDLNDSSTQPRVNRIIFHMLNVVLPKKYGINIKMKPIMWTRGLELIKAGFADGIINASYNDERAAYAVYPMKIGKPDPTKTLRLEVYSLYKNKNSTITWDGMKFDGIDGDIVSESSYAIVNDLRKMGTRQKGRFEVADGSSIFLDEIGELPLELQAKLLRVIEDGEFERLGSSKTIKVNVRIIAAILRAANKQDRINELLKEKGCDYRIGGIEVENKIPPKITFTVAGQSE